MWLPSSSGARPLKRARESIMSASRRQRELTLQRMVASRPLRLLAWLGSGGPLTHIDQFRVEPQLPRRRGEREGLGRLEASPDLASVNLGTRCFYDLFPDADLFAQALAESI